MRPSEHLSFYSFGTDLLQVGLFPTLALVRGANDESTLGHRAIAYSVLKLKMALSECFVFSKLGF